MSHFNHSFHKAFYIDKLVNSTGKKTQDLAADGDGVTLLGGLYKSTDYTNLAADSDLATYAGVNAGGTVANNAYNVGGAKKKFIIASESPRSSTIGGMSTTTGAGATAVTWNSHGGYDESIKSKDIQINFINSLGRADAAVGVSQT